MRFAVRCAGRDAMRCAMECGVQCEAPRDLDARARRLPGSGADTGGLSCGMPRDDLGGRLRFSVQNPALGAPGCATSAGSQASCAGWGAGVWWGGGKMKTKPTRECFPRLAGKKIS